MKIRMVVGFLLLAGWVYGQVPAPTSELTPCEMAEGDVLMLRARVMQLEQQLVTAQLEAERARLESKYKERLKPPEGYVFDWQTKTFKAPQAPVLPPASK